MNDFSSLIQPDRGQPAHLIHLVDKAGFDDWMKAQNEGVRAAVRAQKFTAGGYEKAILPGSNDDDWAVVSGVADTGSLSSWCLAKLAETLPGGQYRLASGEAGPALFGWLTGQYRFDRYRSKPKVHEPRVLLTGEVARIPAILAEAEAVALVRDLVNTPAEDMGPAALEAEARKLAERHKAEMKVTAGDALEQGYPMIHAVGRAAARIHAPRLIEMQWGDTAHPRLALVGKGITFDSGGLDIKPSAGMALMKKDMGGAAHVLALAGLIMASGLKVRLHMLVAAAENAISGHAFRPGDVLNTRKGDTVEITNTDAEGRLVLGDALWHAGEDKPDLVIDYATLTGAARVALGPDLPPLFSRDMAAAAEIATLGKACDDPLWPMPLWHGYDDMLKSDIADMVNSVSGPFAGAITAALFLDKFVPKGVDWFHIDTFAWRPAAKPGRPKGGEALGLRALWRYVQARYAG